MKYKIELTRKQYLNLIVGLRLGADYEKSFADAWDNQKSQEGRKALKNAELILEVRQDIVEQVRKNK